MCCRPPPARLAADVSQQMKNDRQLIRFPALQVAGACARSKMVQMKNKYGTRRQREIGGEIDASVVSDLADAI